jgi:hypothetical protein
MKGSLRDGAYGVWKGEQWMSFAIQADDRSGQRDLSLRDCSLFFSMGNNKEAGATPSQDHHRPAGHWERKDASAMVCKRWISTAARHRIRAVTTPPNPGTK